MHNPSSPSRNRVALSANSCDPARFEWCEVQGDDSFSYEIRHDHTILGYDLEKQTLDMLVRRAPDGGHRPLHRHVATTTLEGLVDGWKINTGAP